MIVVVGGQWCHFPPGGALHLPLHPHRAAGILFISVYFFHFSVITMIPELKCHLVFDHDYIANIAARIWNIEVVRFFSLRRKVSIKLLCATLIA